MARHELGGNPELNSHKDLPTSTYVKLPSKNASTNTKLPIIKEASNGKKIKNLKTN